jgi:hypothetical protein
MRIKTHLHMNVDADSLTLRLRSRVCVTKKQGGDVDIARPCVLCVRRELFQ